MQVKQIMTVDPACCTPDTSLEQVVRLRVECNCGESPVVDSEQSMRPVGVITDCDITCRAVARGKNPLNLTARECMSSPVVTIPPTASIEECCQLMEENQVRRVPVVDEAGRLCGMVAQADIAYYVLERETVQVVKEVFRPDSKPSRVQGGRQSI